MKRYTRSGIKGTESVGCGNANESHCKTLFGLPAQLNSQRLKSAIYKMGRCNWPPLK